MYGYIEQMERVWMLGCIQCMDGCIKYMEQMECVYAGVYALYGWMY